MDDFFDRLFNTATGVFDRLSDFELGKLELELAQQYKLLGLQASADAAPATGTSALNFDFGSIPWVPLAMIVGGASLVWVLVKKYA